MYPFGYVTAFLCYSEKRRSEKIATYRKEVKMMNKTLLHLLVHAKEINKWNATKHLMGFSQHRSIWLYLEDQELLLVQRYQQ